MIIVTIDKSMVQDNVWSLQFRLYLTEWCEDPITSKTLPKFRFSYSLHFPASKWLLFFFFIPAKTHHKGENINSNTFKHSFLENGLEVLLVKFDIITLSWAKVNNSIPFSLINYETHCTAWLSNGKRLWPKQRVAGWKSTGCVSRRRRGEGG